MHWWDSFCSQVKNTLITDEVPDKDSRPVVHVTRLLTNIVAFGLFVLLVGLNFLLSDKHYVQTRHLAAQALGVSTTGLVLLFTAVAFGSKYISSRIWR